MRYKFSNLSSLLIPFVCIGVTIPAGATPPLWWTKGESPVVNGSPENNLSVANLGQAKWMVSEALIALTEYMPDVAHLVMDDLSGTLPDQSDRILDLSLPTSATPENPVPPEWFAQQLSPLTIGQLKAISAPFYKRLNEKVPDWLAAERVANGTNIAGTFYPWTATTSDDANLAVATIGQLKAVFSLRFESSPAVADTDLVWPDPEAVYPEDQDPTGEIEDDGGEIAITTPVGIPALTGGVIFTYDFGRLVKAIGQGVEAAYQYDKAGNIETISPQ